MSSSTPAPAPTLVGPRLSVMMFLQYAVWGIWLPYLANYLTAPVTTGGLGFSGGQVGWILGLAGSIGAISAPFLAGQVADRFLNAERWLAILLVAGGIIKIITASVHDYTTFLILSVLYSIAYMPTLSLTNSIAFAHLRDPEKHFAPVRTWGTIGWIVASNAFPLIWLQTDLKGTWYPPFLVGSSKPNATALLADCLRMSGGISIFYGLWAVMFLPRTPPTRRVEHPLAFARAFELLKHPGFLVVTLAALPISMIHQVYFMRTGTFLKEVGFEVPMVGPVMSIGQFAEIAVLAVLGLFLKRLGFKWVIALGALCFAARYAIFAMAAPGGPLSDSAKPVLLAAMILHGFCYGCFFAGSFIYVDRVAPKDVRHSAQTVFGIIILGVGPVLAALYNDVLERLAVTPGSPIRWSLLWYVQAAVGLGSAVLVAAAFRPGLLPSDKEP